MSYNRYAAELLGTFIFTFVVWLSVAFALPFPTPVMAALTLGLFVYTVGKVSGAHLNPAVTVGLLSIRKIKPNDAVMYVISQMIGAALAMLLGLALTGGEGVSLPHDGGDFLVGFGEAIGAFILTFGVAAAATQKIDAMISGVVVGVSLFVGIYVALPFSNAVLNPAIAFGIGSFGAMYILGPVVGAVAGAWTFVSLYGREPVRAVRA